MRRIVFFIALVISYSCHIDERKSIDDEKQVMAEIFPTLMDSMWVEITFSMMPGPIEEIYDSNSRHSILKLIEKGQSFKNKLIEELEKKKITPGQMTIVVNDTIHAIDKENISYVRKHFRTLLFNDEKGITDSGYKIDFSKYRADKIFNLVYASEFKLEKHDQSREYILSQVSFSRILFDREKTFGVLTCEYNCGVQCGTGYRIFIKKLNDRWKIERIEEGWIA